MRNAAVTVILCAVAVAIAVPASASDRKSCKNCVAPRPHYDSREVVRTTRDVDHSRVINTQSVIHVPSRPVRTRNHLVVRKNTTRHIGVVRHNHTVIEKEIRYVRRVPVPTMTINFVQQRYRTVYRPATRKIPVKIYPRRGTMLDVRG